MSDPKTGTPGAGKWPYPEESATHQPPTSPPDPDLDEALEESFPASDPAAATQPGEDEDE